MDELTDVQEVETDAAESADRFHVQSPTYNGPFELILELIEKRKLSVNEIALTKITDDYIERIRGQASFPIEDAANFIGVAATLLLIKSKSLIPELELTPDEVGDVEELKDRLQKYESVREITRELSRMFGKQVMVSAGVRVAEPIFAPSRDLSLQNLEKSLREALMSMEKEEKLPEARVRPVVTIEEMMDRLTERVQRSLTFSFKDFAGSKAERVEVIVSFLALLELVKQGTVEVDQYNSFGDIKITNSSASVPRYG